MSASRATIPYERQSEAQGNRLCGAASLAMVYRFFGKTVPQSEIWPRISKRNNLGSLASATYLMAQDAISRGFTALAIQAKHPLQSLRVCRDAGIQVIVSHRLKEDLPTGHYSVLVDLDQANVTLHDPYFGPSRQLSHTALLDLWQPGYPNSEITGNVLIGIADRAMTRPPCKDCGTEMPASVNCAACTRPIALEPAPLLGCVGASCAARMWNYLCCPHCDYTWSFALQRADQAETAQMAGAEQLARAVAAIEEFCAKIRSMPEAAANPQVLQYLDAMMASRQRLELATSEQRAHLKQREAQIGALEKDAKQRESRVASARREADTPATTPDGNALGQALLKSLGLLP